MVALGYWGSSLVCRAGSVAVRLNLLVAVAKRFSSWCHLNRRMNGVKLQQKNQIIKSC